MTFLALCVRVAASSAAEVALLASLATVVLLVRAEWSTIRDALAGRHGA